MHVMDEAGAAAPPGHRVDPPDTVGPLDPARRVQAADVLAAALAEDPGYSHLFPDPSRRRRELREVYRMTLADALRYGTVLATTLGDEVTGVLTLYPPGSYPMPVHRWLRQSGRVARIALTTREHSRGIIRFGELTSRGVPPHCWYVEAFGVRPELQRAGRGSVLLRRFFGELDALGAPSYLETTKEDNVGYYVRRGYTERHPVVPLAPGGPYIHPLTRPAAGGR
jgi:GNAT superfamily N-acetyltransferase